MLGREIQTPEGIAQAGLTILTSLIGIVIGIVAIFAFLSRGLRLGKLVLQSAVGGAEITPVRPAAGWLGWFGASSRLPRDAKVDQAGSGDVAPVRQLAPGGSPDVALSDLRPSGIASIDGQRVDVVTSGEHISAGEPIEVVRDEGYRRVVRRTVT
jgi:membrane-bound serine protease (ClpP class)